MAFNIIADRPDVVGPWVYERTGGTFLPQVSQCLGQLDKDGNLVAGVVFEGYNGAIMKGHIAVNPGATLSRAMLWAMGDYAFRQMKVRKVIGYVDSTNERALALDKKLGFYEEARIVGGTPNGDLVLLSLTAENYRFIRLTADDIIKRS
jgi:hypothetical protein